MPVKSRRPKTRLHAAVALTPERLHFLITGYDFFDDKPFIDAEEASACWLANREEILAIQDARFPPGCRPAGFWKYEQGRPKPEHQAAVLDELGLLSPEEKATVISLARAAWLKHSSTMLGYTRAEAESVTDEELLYAWPNITWVDYYRKTSVRIGE